MVLKYFYIFVSTNKLKTMNNLQSITINWSDETTEFLYDGKEYILDFKFFNPQLQLKEMEEEGINLDIYENDDEAILNSLSFHSDKEIKSWLKDAKIETCCGDIIENKPEVYRCPTCKEAV